MFISLKFGGTSVGSIEAMQKCLSIVKDFVDKKNQVIVTVSALSGVTSELLKICNLCKDRTKENKPEVEDLISLVYHRHYTFVKELFGFQKGNEFFLKSIEPRVKEVSTLAHAALISKTIPDSTVALICSFGEIASSIIFAELLNENDLKAKQVLATQIIKTHDSYLYANVLYDDTKKNCQKFLEPIIAKGVVPVVTGFIGSNLKNETTLLGRGSSDYTASILGAALEVDKIAIYTDVDGVMSADPRVVKDVKSFKEISIEMMSEMAYAGAKVLHPKAILPAAERHIPIFILNTFNLNFLGTKIYLHHKSVCNKIQAIASLDNQVLINCIDKNRENEIGWIAKVSDIAQKYAVPIDVCATSETMFSFTVPEDVFSQAFIEELNTIVVTTYTKNMSKVSIIGDGVSKEPEVLRVLGQEFSDNQIIFEMLTIAPYAMSVAIIMQTDYAKKAVEILHSNLVL
jgi:aspartate kinase